MNMGLLRLRRYARQLLRCFWLTFREPIAGPNQLFMATIAWLVLVLTLRTATPEQRDVLAAQWAIWFEAAAYAVAGWAVISILYAPYRAFKEERLRGTWHGTRFIYHQPILIKTLRCKATGEIEQFRFKVPDVEPGAFIFWDIDLEGPIMVAEIDFGGTIFMTPRRLAELGNGGFLLPRDNHAIFRIRLPVQADSATVRLYCTSFTVGNPLDKDGHTGDYNPVKSN
jgi:hypothetical protein